MEVACLAHLCFKNYTKGVGRIWQHGWQKTAALGAPMLLRLL